MNSEFLSTKQQLGYVAIGGAVGVLYVFLLILFILPVQSSFVGFNELDFEKLDEYDALCIGKDCIVKVTDKIITTKTDTEIEFTVTPYNDNNVNIEKYDQKRDVVTLFGKLTFKESEYGHSRLLMPNEDRELHMFASKKPLLGKIFNFILPSAYAQIEPFELQLEQISNPQDCTRKVVQGRSAEIPFTLKVFYPTTREATLEVSQQLATFPITQRTNQVMMFYTNGTDQYRIFMEMNYEDVKERQVYIEYLSGSELVQSEQEKFSGNKFCVEFFVNTKLPEKQFTREELFGDVYDTLAQVPAMVNALNNNTITWNSSINFMWLLIIASLGMTLMTLISVRSDRRAYRNKINALDDSLETIAKIDDKLDNVVRQVAEPLETFNQNLEELKKHPVLKESFKKKDSKKQKVSSLTRPFRRVTKIIPRKDPDEMSYKEILGYDEQNAEELMSDEDVVKTNEDEELQEDDVQEKVLEAIRDLPDDTEKEPPEPEEMDNTTQEIMESMNPETMEEDLDRFTYSQLNKAYSWIKTFENYSRSKNGTGLDENQQVIMTILWNKLMDKYKKMMSGE